MIPTSPMQSSSKDNPVQIVYCTRMGDLSDSKRRYTLAEYLPRSEVETESVVYLAPITASQRSQIKKQFKGEEGEEMEVHLYNTLLDSFLVENGFDGPIIFASVSLQGECDQCIVSILGDDEAIVGHDYMDIVIDTVTRVQLPSNIYEHELPNGKMLEKFYSWPFESSVSGNWMDLVNHTFSGKGLL